MITWFLAVAALSALLCGLYLRSALARVIVDRPNHRSSHARVTPRGGGLPLLLAFFGGLALYAMLEAGWPSDYLLVAAMAGALMLLGLADDLRNLSVRLRLGCYALVSLLTAYCFLYDAFALGPLITLGLVFVAAFGLLWLLNLYNFMDGIDGIAATQAVAACVFAALLSDDPGGYYPMVCMLLAGAHGGFLLWNRPPARLFMGDTGSVATGFLLGALALIGWVQGVLNPLCWLVLLALFIVDASWTLLARLLRGDNVAAAHREHAYQRLSRHWESHARVDLYLLAIVMLWLAPIAWLINSFPAFGFILVILAYLPWVIGMAKLRSLT